MDENNNLINDPKKIVIIIIITNVPKVPRETEILAAVFEVHETSL